MGVNAETLRRLAALQLPSESLSEVLSIIADMQTANDARKEKDRIRKRNVRGQSKEVPQNVQGNADGQPPSPSPPRDIINPPNPSPSSFSLRSNETRDERASAAASDFERFWSVWPNKVGKPAAAKAFFRVRSECEAIIAGVPNYVADVKATGKPWLNPATFLNQRRWEDSPAPQPMARAGPTSSNRNGFAALGVEMFGFGNGTGSQERRANQALHLLPVCDVGRQDDGSSDGLEIFGNARDGLG